MDKKLSDDKWKKILTPEQYQVMREKATEAPFEGKYWDSHEKGMCHCVACGQELFSSDVKFDSGTGWPSFYDVAKSDAVELKSDKSMGLERVEVVCKNCGLHLGHLFDDGPAKHGGKRYCINSCVLKLYK